MKIQKIIQEEVALVRESIVSPDLEWFGEYDEHELRTMTAFNDGEKWNLPLTEQGIKDILIAIGVTTADDVIRDLNGVLHSSEVSAEMVEEIGENGLVKGYKYGDIEDYIVIADKKKFISRADQDLWEEFKETLMENHQ